MCYNQPDKDYRYSCQPCRFNVALQVNQAHVFLILVIQLSQWKLNNFLDQEFYRCNIVNYQQNQFFQKHVLFDRIFLAIPSNNYIYQGMENFIFLKVFEPNQYKSFCLNILVGVYFLGPIHFVCQSYLNQNQFTCRTRRCIHFNCEIKIVIFFGGSSFHLFSFSKILIFSNNIIISIFSSTVVHFLNGWKRIFHLEELYIVLIIQIRIGTFVPNVYILSNIVKFIHYINLINNLIDMFFELDDIKRRHMPNWSINNTTAWSPAMDSNLTWNFQRGIMVGLFACTIQEYVSHFINNTKLMLKHYEPPTNFNQATIFVKQTLKLQSYTQGMKNVTQKALYGGLIDMSSKIALFRYMNSGWSCNFGGFQYNFYRKIPTMLLPFIITSPLSVVYEMVNRAVVADKTFPKQLQKGYKGFFDALRRITLEEGPFYLFKNTFPHYVKHILGPFTAFYTFDWMKDKLSVLWRTSNTPMWPILAFCAGFGTYLGAIFTYPFAVTARQMVDLWPKKNGVDIWQGNYRKAASWLWFAAPSWNIAFPGLFKNYFWHVAPMWFLSILAADHLGIFSYWRTDIMSGPGDNSNDDSFI